MYVCMYAHNQGKYDNKYMQIIYKYDIMRPNHSKQQYSGLSHCQQKLKHENETYFTWYNEHVKDLRYKIQKIKR